MSYNGIGLSTARGSGTNGFIQKNASHTSRREGVFEGRMRFEKERDRGYRRSEQQSVTNRIVDNDILSHNRKREIESKCFDLRVELEDAGEPEEEIEKKVGELRQRLKSEDELDARRYKQHQVHELSAAKVAANKRFEEAMERHNERDNRRWRGKDWRHNKRERSRSRESRPMRHERDGSVTPPRRERRRSISPSRRRTDRDGSVTPPRRERDRSFTPPPRRRRDSDGSVTPPRHRRDSDGSVTPPRRARDRSTTPPRRRREDDDSRPADSRAGRALRSYD